ncbi:hypothetical protein B0H16DRAFT_1462141 [Mycena metata]|uniref:Uncharacterized protein n=1 Tax=Mycena metata TaxID=1033252 RepID=A0AAD7N760_9AGAR|nr:hypothetical protein B0H16DRAFT_1462141 [Mycena metata]
MAVLVVSPVLHWGDKDCKERIPEFGGDPMASSAEIDAASSRHGGGRREVVIISISGLLNARDFPSELLEPTRLAKKYQIDWILKDVATQLQKSWPTTLLGWDAIIADEEEEESTGMGGWSASLEDRALDLRLFPEPVSSIHIARLCNTPTIFPFAFYRLLTWPTPENSDDEMDLAKNTPRKELLPRHPEDWKRLSVARERIGTWFLQVSPTPSKPCSNQPPCQENTNAWFSFGQKVGRNGDFLLFSKMASDPDLWCSLVRGLCPACASILQQRFNALRRKFADQLSYFFQLDEVMA